jgi:hypothetical protein
VTVTTCSKGFDITKKSFTNLSKFYRNAILGREQDPIPGEIEHFADYLTLPPTWEEPDGNVIYEDTATTTASYGPDGPTNTSPTTTPKRECSAPELAALQSLVESIFTTLNGMPVRAELITMITARYGIVLPPEVKSEIQREEKYVKTQVLKKETETGEQIFEIRIEENDDGQFVDVISGEYVIV